MSGVLPLPAPCVAKSQHREPAYASPRYASSILFENAVICWDQWYLEAARIMALRGADLLLYLNGYWVDAYQDIVKLYKETHCMNTGVARLLSS